MKDTETITQITILFERILSLEITISAILEELVEMKVIDSDKVNEKVEFNLERLNEEVKKINSLSKEVIYMGNQMGEA